MHEIEEFTSKLENGRLEIAAFGEVGSGKSALLNALAGEKIFAVSAEHGSTDKVSKTGFKNTKLVLVDTPGINEAAGELRGKLAEETVRYTDLVLFVADGDLNRVEIEAFTAAQRSAQADAAGDQQSRPLWPVADPGNLGIDPAQGRQPAGRRRYRLCRGGAEGSRAGNPQGRRHDRDRRPSSRSPGSRLWKRACWKSSIARTRRSSRSMPACSLPTSATASRSSSSMCAARKSRA